MKEVCVGNKGPNYQAGIQVSRTRLEHNAQGTKISRKKEREREKERENKLVYQQNEVLSISFDLRLR